MVKDWIDKTGASACITDIQRFSVHDGPGIRTIVFLKGCPLRCKWCQNPETQRVEPEIMFSPGTCVGCRKCAAECPQQAIEVTGNGVLFHRDRCNNCGTCAGVCGPEARRLVGRKWTLDEVVQAVLADRIFYKNSRGGLTVSGGEPTMQAEFTARLMQAVKKEDISTAMETCGMCEQAKFLTAIADCDLLLFDVKHTDPQVHKAYTGVDNQTILNNLYIAAEQQKQIIIRIPLIPDVNDDEKNLMETARLAKAVHAKEIHLLPFHQMGQEKWHGLNKKYECENMSLLPAERIAFAADTLKRLGATVNVGGYGEYQWISV